MDYTTAVILTHARIMMPTETTRTSPYRALLLAIAILFATATVTYSVLWMYLHPRIHQC